MAGSERLDYKGQRDLIKETKNINSSLSCLNRVISALLQLSRKKVVSVPYRESKLTRVLQNSLDLNSRVVIITTFSPNIS